MPLMTRTPVVPALALLASLGTAPFAAAQSPAPAPLPPMTTPAKPVFTIRGFSIQGDDPLPAGESTRVLAPFLRADATLESLQKATAALEEAFKQKGFALHRVVLPPQTISDTVQLQIVRFALAKVTVEGLKPDGAYDEANIRASLPELQEGASPNFKTLSVQTAIANESQGKQVQIALKEAAVADQIDARIVVTESKPWNFAVGLANTGSKATGHDRFTVSGSHANVFNLDHQFVGAYTTSLEKGDDVRQYGANYKIPLYKLGGVLGASYTRSTVVGDFGALTSTGAGQTMGLNYSHYLPPDGGYRSYVTLGLDDRRFDPAKVNGLPTGQLTRRSRPLSLGYTANVQSDTALWGYDTTLSLNTSAGSGNSLAAYRSEDPRITSRNFKVLRANARYLAGFGEGWLWSVRAQAQWSPDALISGEQLGLGGASTLRGTDERPISGDSGLSGTLELTTPEVHPGLRFLGFVDAGWLRNHTPTPNPNPNKPARDQLASVGLGLRYQAGLVALSAEWGRIVTGSDVAAINPSAPRAGDNKLHVNFSLRF